MKSGRIRRSRAGAVLGLHRGNLRTALLVVGCLVGQPSLATVAAGATLVGLGLALHLASKGTLRQNRAIARRGPYRWVRHPFYLANLSIDAGLAIAIGQPWLVAAYLAVWVHVYGATMREEETLLESLFGEAYRRYAARVPRLFPWRRPLPRDPDADGFSWRNPNLVRGSEYSRIARTLAALPLIWLAARARALVGEGSWGPEQMGAALADEAAVLALFAGLELVQRGLTRHFKHHRPVLPGELRTVPVVVMSTAAIGMALLATPLLETDPGLGGPVLAAGAGQILLVAIATRAPSSFGLVALATAALLASALVGLLWLGILAATWFLLLALDAHGERLRGPAPTTWFRPLTGRAVLACTLLLFLAAATEEGREEGWLEGLAGAARPQAELVR